MVDTYESDPDVRLMLGVGKGDALAFESLVLKYQKAVINAAYRYTGNPAVAEELAQEIFVRVYKAAPTYRPEARFSTWLFTIVRNMCTNYRTREGKYDLQTESDATFLHPATKNNPESGLLRKELEQKIQLAIEALPESLRLPFIFYQFNQMHYDEIAKILEISLSAVKVRIHRARMILAEKLKDYVYK